VLDGHAREYRQRRRPRCLRDGLDGPRDVELQTRHGVGDFDAPALILGVADQVGQRAHRAALVGSGLGQGLEPFSGRERERIAAAVVAPVPAPLAQAVAVGALVVRREDAPGEIVLKAPVTEREPTVRIAHDEPPDRVERVVERKSAELVMRAHVLQFGRWNWSSRDQEVPEQVSHRLGRYRALQLGPPAFQVVVDAFRARGEFGG